MAHAIGQADDATILSQVRQRLADVLDKSIYELWFADRERLAVRNGQLIVRGSSEFELGRIRRIYGETFQSVVRNMTMPVDGIDYELYPELPTSAADDSAECEQTTANSNGSRSDGAVRANHRKSAPQCHAEGRRSRGDNLADFVYGKSNYLVRAAMEQIESQPGRFSPVVLCGPTGCGKTHLLEGIVARMRGKPRFGHCAYVTAEEFTNAFVESVRGSGLPAFRRKYRDLHLLALDDFQFMAGKRATLAEFQYTLDHLSRAGRQVVIAVDRPLTEIVGVGEEIMVRLTCGLVSTIAPADVDVRRQLLERGARRRNIALDTQVLDFLAVNMPGDARRIQGAINRLHAWQLCQRRTPELADCRDLLRDLLFAPMMGITLPRIEQAVCECCGVEPQELRSESRSRRIASARMLAMWLARRHTTSALSDIGRYFGGRSHSSVIAAQKKVESWLKSEDTSLFAGGEGSWRDTIHRIEQRLKIG